VHDFEPAARSSLLRGTFFYLLLTVADAVVCYYIFTNRQSGAAFITLSLVGAVGILLAYQTLQHARDIGAPLAETEGAIARKWQRADLIIAWQSYYVAVNRVVFRINPEDYVMVDEGMYVKVVHFAHTLGVVSVHEAPRADRIAPGD